MTYFEPVRYLYTAWFRDHCASPEDEDFEWPACLVVVSPTEAGAKTWGDHLAHSFSQRRGVVEFLGSAIEPAPDNCSDLVVVKDGCEVSDAEIGW